MSNRINITSWASDSSDDSEPNDGTSLLRNKQSSTYQAIEDHRQGLEKLDEAVKRQKTAAHSLATEVDLHNEILDDIDTGLAATNIHLRKNTRNIKLVSKKASTLCLWTIIVLLAVVIIILAVI